MALSSSSFSSSSRTCVYDVFPSFSGEDVRVTFLSHFLMELDRKLIIAFKDNEIPKSLSLDPELKQAIRDSRIAVVIFSKNYASSSWCLNELLEIVKCRDKCGQKVIPVFYGLDPSHVRKQTGDFGKIFEETCKNKKEKKIIQWRRALTDVANTLGYHSVKWDNEAKLIEKIVSDVLEKLLLTPSMDSENFVGIEDHIAKMSVLLQLELEEVRMVGLWGPSGIGKTTIARVMFNRLSRHFQCSIFIDRGFVYKSMEIFNSANPEDYNMKLHLQRNFLSEILGKGDIKINHLSSVEERLKHHKVLIFIDDLNDRVVLDALVGQTQWFGSGSRIILVTNDKHFLIGHKIDHIYEVCLPSEEIAVEMLCQAAFRKTFPPGGFKEFVAEVAHHVGRLPLALSVVGSSLRGRDKEYWMDLLRRIQNGIDGEIEKILRVSYDGLSIEEDKTMFRYIACYFNGAEVTYMKLLTDICENINVRLKNLADKSLIHVRKGRVEMHRLLQEMGKKVVRLEKPKNREFLEDSQDICDVLSEGIGIQKVIGITLDIDEIDELYVHKNAFKGMRNLRFLKFYYSKYRLAKLHLPENFDYLPPKLKLLDWYGYPMRCMPFKFQPENLVELKMENSKLEKLWGGILSLTCLKQMDLRGSEYLIEMPDLSKATNLETLNLEYCYSLVKLPPSIPHPNKLKELNMRNCRNVETIPIGISLKSLQKLNLYGCSRLRTFPEISTNIEDLRIGETSIEEFPSDLHLENLRYFSMNELKSKRWERVQVLTLLTAIMSPSLEWLFLSDIPTLVELPCSFQNLRRLLFLEITNCVNLETLPTGINLQHLTSVNLSGCSRLKTFPDISTNIKFLFLNETGIEEVPYWIEKFSNLEILWMNGCNNLEYAYLNISKLEHLQKVELSDCKALTKASWSDRPTSVVNYFQRSYIHIAFTKCFNLDQEALFQLKTYSDYKLRLSGEEMPSYFTHRATATSSFSSSIVHLLPSYFTHRTTGVPSSSFLTVPLLPSSLSQPFLRFRACLVLPCNNTSEIKTAIRFTGSFRNSFDSYDQAQDFCAHTEDYEINSYKKDSPLLILDCQMSHIPLEMNFDDVDMRLYVDDLFHSPIDIKEWGIRILEEDCSSMDNRLGNPNTLPHVFEGDTLNEAGEGGESAGEDEVTEPSRKRVRIT